MDIKGAGLALLRLPLSSPSNGNFLEKMQTSLGRDVPPYPSLVEEQGLLVGTRLVFYTGHMHVRVC